VHGPDGFGDCCTYEVASVAGEPLLCLGDDFAKTDLLLVSLDTDVTPS
jgi:ribonuclease VapC